MTDLDPVECQCGGLNWPYRTACSFCGSSSLRNRSRLPRKGYTQPLRLLPPPDYSWLDNLTSEVARAQELFERTREDWEDSLWRAKESQHYIDSAHLNERALPPNKRHQYIVAQSDIAYERGCWEVHERARERYFRLLNELAEAEKTAATRVLRPGGFADPLDPYRNPDADDGGIKWAQKQQELAEKEKKHEPARWVNRPDWL